MTMKINYSFTVFQTSFSYNSFEKKAVYRRRFIKELGRHYINIEVTDIKR
jgi:hypothetical protein